MNDLKPAPIAPGRLARMSAIERPRQPSLTEQVQQRLTDSIVDGTLAAGQLLVIDQLAVALGVSKTPVRESLHGLWHDGLIQETEAGFRVAPLDGAYVREVYAVRSALESLAVEAVVGTLAEADLIALEATLKAGEPHQGTSQYMEHLGPDLEFHDLIRARCPWPYLNRLIDTVNTHRTRVRALEVNASALSRKEGLEEHRAILEALRRQDGAVARKLMQAHLDRLGALVAGLVAVDDVA